MQNARRGCSLALCLRPFERSARGKRKECPQSQCRTLLQSKIKLHEGLHANNAVGFDATHAGKIVQAKIKQHKRFACEHAVG